MCKYRQVYVFTKWRIRKSYRVLYPKFKKYVNIYQKTQRSTITKNILNCYGIYSVATDSRHIVNIFQNGFTSFLDDIWNIICFMNDFIDTKFFSFDTYIIIGFVSLYRFVKLFRNVK
jgi:hypothetical protein